VLDEAHTIKNSNTEAAKACYMVRVCVCVCEGCVRGGGGVVCCVLCVVCVCKGWWWLCVDVLLCVCV
jgi:hypothetical protein